MRRRLFRSRFSTAILAGSLIGLLCGVEAVSLAQSRVLTFDEIRAIAAAQVPGATAFEIELHASPGTRGLYEVEVHDARGVEHDLGIDAVSGEVLYDQIDD